MARETPMLRQYRKIKGRYPEALVLYRLGDFYELFEDDAKIAARELDLVLTSRRFGKGLHLPMCGVPYRTVTGYIGRLIERGYKVALVEQLEDARKAKGLVKRDVVRVITPGTVVEEVLLEEKAENFLAAIAPGKAGYGLAFVELSTGEFSATQAPELHAILEELYRLRPSELVLPVTLNADETFISVLESVHPARLSPISDIEFVPETAVERLQQHLSVASLEAFGCDDLPLATAAAGAILAYLLMNQPDAMRADDGLAHLRHLSSYNLATHMHLDNITRRNLELTRTLRDGRAQGSLLSVLDSATTAMGSRVLQRWVNQPSLDLHEIQARLDAVEELISPPTLSPVARDAKGSAFLREDLRRLLSGLYDVERLVGRIGFGSANGRDLVGLKQVLERLPRITTLLGTAQSDRLSSLGKIDEKPEVLALICQAIVDRPPILVKEGGLIRTGYHPELDELRASAEAGRDWLARYEMRERTRTGIKSLRIKYNEVFGFFIEVTKSNLDLVPDDYERRATITHAERFVTPELRAKEAAIIAAEDRAKDLEYELFVDVRRRVAQHAEDLRGIARTLAQLDALASLAEMAVRYGYVRPVVDEGDEIQIIDGWHPVVERLLPEGERFVTNDVRLNQDDERVLVITGPNMAGKSVYIRQVALTVLMAQMGSFCPAASAHIGIADRIFLRAGASDDIAQGRSTFLVEMSETAYILRHATPRSLIVLDEVGRGTSTYDGVGLAWAVGEYLHNTVRARSLFATHYHELTALADHLPALRNYTLAVKEHGDDVIFFRRVVSGSANRSYGVRVARLAGLPESVVTRAKEVMTRLEKDKRDSGELGELFELAERIPSAVQEAPAPYVLEQKDETLLLPGDDAALRSIVHELFSVDVANMTPVQALVRLNDWQRQLRGEA